ncbi:hypothetical protein HK100_009268, partial [Physocladia obscura]
LRLLDDARTDIHTIENDIAAVQGTLEGRSYVSIRLLQLQIEIQALRERRARYERMAENAETPFGLRKALCLKANTNKAIHTIDARISDLNSEQSFLVSDPSLLAPNVSTDPQNNIVFETLAPVDSRASNYRKISKVMVSYCWGNKDIARPVAQLLKDNGYDVWIDTTNMTVNLNSAMANAINDANVVLAFISDDYVKSHNCNREIEYANDRRKLILPVRLSHSDLVNNSAAAFITAGKLCEFFRSPSATTKPSI